MGNAKLPQGEDTLAAARRRELGCGKRVQRAGVVSRKCLGSAKVDAVVKTDMVFCLRDIAQKRNSTR